MLGRFVNSFEEGAISFLLAVMTLITFSQVVARYVFNAGAVWALELTVYLFAWLVLFGMSYGFKIGVHLGVDAFVKVLPARGQRILVLVSAFACIAYAVIMLVGAYNYYTRIAQIGIPTEDLYVPRVIVEALYPGEAYEEVPIPKWVPYAILPVGLVLLLYRLVEATWQVWTGKRQNITASHEAEDMVREAHELLDVPGEEDTIPAPHRDGPHGAPGRGPGAGGRG